MGLCTVTNIVFKPVDHSSVSEAQKSRGARQGIAAFRAQSYLDVLSFFIPSFDMSPFDMLSSDFIAPFFVFFFFLALGSIGLLVFMESWPGGLVVWAEAIDTLPTKATQHTAMSKFRILISCWNKRPRRMKSKVI